MMKRFNAFSLLLISILFSLPFPAFAWRTWNVERVAVLDEAAEAYGATDVEIVGDLAYTIGQQFLRVYNVQDPANPELLSEIEEDGIGVSAIGDLLVVMLRHEGYNGGIALYDISDPVNPAWLFADTSFLFMGKPFRENDFLYLSAYRAATYGIIVYDISDPTSADSVGYLSFDQRVDDIAFRDGLLYVTYVGGFAIYQLDDPLSLQEPLSECDTLTRSHCCFLDGDRAFIGSWGRALWTLDISDPTELRLLGYCQVLPSDGIMNIFVRDNYAYVAAGTHGFRVWDLADLNHVDEVGFWNVPPSERPGDYSYATNVIPLGDKFFTAYRTKPEIYDFDERGSTISISPMSLDFSTLAPGQSNQQTIVLTNHGHLDQTVTDMRFAGGWFSLDFARPYILRQGETAEFNVTFAPDETGEFYDSLLIDVEDCNPPPRLPVHASATTMNEVYNQRILYSVRDVWFDGDCIYVSGYPNQRDPRTFSLLSINNPAEPSYVNSVSYPQGSLTPQSLWLHNDTLYGPYFRAIDWDRFYNGVHRAYRDGEVLRYIDYTDFDIEEEGMVSNVCRSDRYYVVSTSAGVSVTDLASGEIVIYRDWSFFGEGAVQPFGDNYFVADYVEGDGRRIGVFDFSEVDNPRLLASLDLGEMSPVLSDMKVSDGIVYVSLDDLRIFDFTDLDNPIELNRVVTPGSARGLFLENDLLAMSDFNSVRIFDINNPADVKLLGVNFTPSIWVGMKDNYLYSMITNGQLQVFDIVDILDQVGDELGQEISLAPGWQCVSLNITPPREFWRDNRGPSIPLLWSQLDRGDGGHAVRLLKDERGRFWWPDLGFNNIPYWDLTQAYQIRLDSAATATWRGDPIDPQADIPLEQGWNLIAYYPEYDLPATSPNFTALAPILDHVIIAKNADGDFMLPAFEFSNMPAWSMGKGYQVKVDADVILNYPVQGERANSNISKTTEKPTHWTALKTGRNMSLLTSISKGIASSTELGVFTEAGLCVGSVSLNGNGLTGLAVWGDDPTTDEVDGAMEGESLSYRLWNGSSESTPEVTFTLGENSYATDDFRQIGLGLNSTQPTTFDLAQVYPNPFNSTALLKFSLPEDSNIRLFVTDIAGREVTILMCGDLKAGDYSTVWKADATPAGIYLVTLKSERQTITRKVLLLK